jgi:hypothetical protein
MATQDIGAAADTFVGAMATVAAVMLGATLAAMPAVDFMAVTRSTAEADSVAAVEVDSTAAGDSTAEEAVASTAVVDTGNRLHRSVATAGGKSCQPFLLCAGVRQLGGANPLPNLMEVKG